MTRFHSVSAFVSRSGRHLADLLWPPACIGCGAAVMEPDRFCAACWKRLPHITSPRCIRYGVPLPFDLGPEAVSARAISDPPVFGRARGAFLYDGLARDLVHRLKYHDRTELARPLARAMAFAGHDLLADATGLVPIPLHRFRFFNRRYNQAALLAREIGLRHHLPVHYECLTRVKSTRPQVGLTRSERAENLAGAFRLSPTERLHVAGQRLILVDDVMTSSATGNAAARLLMRAGAASVDLLVFAVVANF
ncbi:MAG: ComF family protein [Betaproteobacteria bacterium]|nr:ComF family protein [Betaproteobacteria bacterium]